MPTSRRGRIRSARAKSERNRGWVYLIHVENDVYKIGRTLDVYSRLREMEKQCFHAPRILWSMDVEHMRLCEWYLHHKYRHKRIKGEFFRLKMADVDEILALKQEGAESLYNLAIESYPPIEGSYQDYKRRLRGLGEQ